MKKLFALLIAVLIIFTTSINIYASAFDYTSLAEEYEWRFLKQLNEKRDDALTIFPSLQKASQIRANELLAELSHYRPDATPWYTVLDSQGIGYDTYSFEAIAANIDLPIRAVNAMMDSQSKEQLLSDVGHIGIGYGYSKTTKNNYTWSVIGVPCNGITSLSLRYDELHITDGRLNADNVIIEAVCRHGKSYAPLKASMIKGYAAEKIGKQTLTVSYRGKSCELIVYNDYKDVSYDRWYYDAIMDCTGAGIFSGTGEGKFEPTKAMTREMAVTALGKLAGINTANYSQTPFKDVKADRWSAPYIAWASKKGIVSGYDDNSFKAAKAITRQELCCMIKNYIDTTGKTIGATQPQKSFSDNNDISSWARQSVVYLQRRGIVTGDTKGAFNPRSTATRAEVAVIISKLQQLVT